LCYGELVNFSWPICRQLSAENPIKIPRELGISCPDLSESDSLCHRRNRRFFPFFDHELAP